MRFIHSLCFSLETQGTPATIVGIANAQTKCGNRLRALQLLLVSIPHPAAIPKTKVEAQKLASDLKDKLTLEEVNSAHAFAGAMMLESVAKELIEAG